MKPLISVIIPVYKVEPYLRRAVDSVLNQTYRNLDIILVDDGSTDRCPVICDEYAKKEARVRVIHKENGGLSDARNAGLDVAGGDYIAFLDSDDFYGRRFIEILYDSMIKNEAQVAVCPYQVVGHEDTTDKHKDVFKIYENLYASGKYREQVYDRKELLMNQYDAHCPDATYFIVAWNKLYEARLWKDIRFPKGKIHEDEATVYKVFDRAKKGVYVDLSLYAYYMSAGSITRDRFNIKRLDWMDALTDRIEYFEKQDDYALAGAAMRARADGSIKYYYQLISHVEDNKKQRLKLKGYVRQALAKNKKGPAGEKRFLSVRNVLGYMIFIVSPSLYKKILKKRF